MFLGVAGSACSRHGSSAPSATPAAVDQGASPTARSATDTARDDRWREDLQYLARELVARHPNAFFATSKANFDRAVANLNSAIPRLRDDEVIAGMARLVALLDDGHTVLPVLQKGTGFRVYPLSLAWFPDGLYVVAARQQDRDAVGKRIVRIGQMSTEQALAAVAPLVSHENNQWLLAQSPGYLVTAEVLHDAGVEGDADHGHFLLDANGKQSLLDLDAVAPSSVGQLVSAPNLSGDALPLYRRQPAKAYWFQYLPGQQTAYVQYNRAVDDPALPFATFSDQVFAYVDSHPVARFVVDLRNNVGGDSRVIQPLINALAARPALAARGCLFVIVGRNTFSSGLLAATDLKKAASPLLFGEPTGGKPDSYGDVLTFALPNSGLSVTYSTKYFKTQDQDTPSLDPDVNVSISAADFFAGRDPVLEAVLAYHP